MLLRLAYLVITNAFALLRLLPGSDRDKDVEILALRHQLAVLHRQLDGQRVHFDPADRAWLAALLHQLPDPTCTTCGCWSDPTLCCAGTVTCSPAACARCMTRSLRYWPPRPPAEPQDFVAKWRRCRTPSAASAQLVAHFPSIFACGIRGDNRGATQGHRQCNRDL